ncbi:hypothetical protein FQA39_LY14808 [Lamprigera yunnana]|nr:hypothetical protein FQA39_LY14808 [Lamprigera yunnana]
MSGKQLLDVLEMQSDEVQSDLDVSSASESEYVPSDDEGAVKNSDDAGVITDREHSEVSTTVNQDKLKYIQTVLENQNRQLNEIPSETVHFNNISVWTIVTYLLIAPIIITVILRYYKRKFKNPTNGKKQEIQGEGQEEGINPQQQNPRQSPRFLI